MSPENLENNLARAAELQREWNRCGFAFIATDLETSLTFAHLALEARDNPEKRQRNRANARKGYDSIRRFMDRLDRSTIGTAELADVDEKLLRLKSLLQELGEELPS